MDFDFKDFKTTELLFTHQLNSFLWFDNQTEQNRIYEENLNLLFWEALKNTLNKARVYSMKKNESDDPDYIAYWKEQELIFKRAHISASELLRNHFFIDNNKLVELSSPVQIQLGKNTNEKDYQIYFVLALKYLKHEPRNIEPFVRSQLRTNFKNSAQKFLEFLQEIELTFDYVLNKKILAQAITILISKLPIQKKFPSPGRKSKTAINTSFVCKKEYLKGLYDPIKMLAAITSLRENNYLDSGTTAKQLKDLFDPKTPNLSKKINWINSQHSLRLFMQIIHNKNGFIESTGRDFYYIVIKSFTVKGEEISHSSISGASGKKELHQETLSKIANDLFLG